MPGRKACASSSSATLSGPPDTAMPSRSPTGQRAAQSASKRAIRCGSSCLSIAGHFLPVGFILLQKAAGGKRRISLAKFGQRDAGALGIAQFHHALGKEQKAVAGARRLLVSL